MAVASMGVRAQAAWILMPSSEDEAIAAFGDGADIVVVGGGLIVLPDMTYRQLRPSKALMLGRAGIQGRRGTDRVTIGATTPVRELTGWQPVSGRARATSLISRSARREPSAETSAGRGLGGAAGRPAGRVPRRRRDRALRRGWRRHRGAARGLPRQARRAPLLSVSFDQPAAGAFAGLDRPHTHDYTASRCRAHARRTGHSASRRQERARGGPVSHRPRLQPETRLPRAKRRSRTSRRTTTPLHRPGTARRCSRCSCAASSPS